MNPYEAMSMPARFHRRTFVQTWGVDYDPKQIVGDLDHAMTVSMRQDAPPVRHIAILGSMPPASTARMSSQRR